MLVLQQQMGTTVQDILCLWHCQAEFCLVQHVLFLKIEMYCCKRRTDSVPKYRITSHHKLMICIIMPWILHFLFLSLHVIFIWLKRTMKKRININWMESCMFWQTVMTFHVAIHICFQDFLFNWKNELAFWK